MSGVMSLKVSHGAFRLDVVVPQAVHGNLGASSKDFQLRQVAG
jgi:hypothetical protein